MNRANLAALAIVALLALGAPAEADSVSVQQSPFDGFFGINLPGRAFGFLIFPGPYQLTFQTIPSSQQNTFLDGSLVVTGTNYGPGGSVDVVGPNGFQLTGIFTDAESGIFTNTVPIPGFPIGSTVGFSLAAAFTGSLTDGEQWQGTFGVEQNLCCNEPSPSFLEMMSVPEPGTLLLLCAGMFGLACCRRRFNVGRGLLVNYRLEDRRRGPALVCTHSMMFDLQEGRRPFRMTRTSVESSVPHHRR